jgi:glycosyltransferase involved in cell wall biosynthesis
MIEVENPTLEFIPSEKREPGVSGILRVKNGEDFLQLCVESIIDQIDELICVYNDCTDNTENILIELEKKYSKKVKVFHYLPKVYPSNKKIYAKITDSDPRGMAMYYNFALSKTTKKYVMKFDDDMLMLPNAIEMLLKAMKKNHYVGIRGINLLDYNQELHYNTKHPLTAGRDIILFEYNKRCHYYNTSRCEVFRCPYKLHKVITCFYHLKLCKRDRGHNNYKLDESKTRFFNAFKKVMISKNFQKFNHKQFNMPASPEELGFSYVNKSIKTYNSQDLQQIENNFKL